MAYKEIFPHNYMVAYAGANNARMVGSMAGESIKIMNFTNYGVTVKITQEVIDYIPPYQYLIMPNNTAIELILDTVSSADYVYPYASVTAKTFDEVLSYLIGSLLYFTTQSPGDTVNVAGNMTINGTPNVNIGNTPSVTITGTPNINIANVPSMNINSSSTLPVSFVGTQNVNIANTPSMIISGTPAVTLTGTGNSVNIGNVPAVTISGTPSVTLSGAGNSVNIANTPAVTVTGTPAVNVSNTSIPVANASGGTLNIAGQVNIGNTANVNISSSATIPITFASTQNVNIANVPSVAISSGTVNANINNATLNTSVINALLSNSSSFSWTGNAKAITNLAASASVILSIAKDISIPYSIIDKVSFIVKSNLAPQIKLNYQLDFLGMYTPGGGYIPNSNPTTNLLINDGTNLGTTAVIPFLSAILSGNGLDIRITNISGATIANDTLTIIPYFHYSTTQTQAVVPVVANNFAVYQGTFAPFLPTRVIDHIGLPPVMQKFIIHIYKGTAVIGASSAIQFFDDSGTANVLYASVDLSGLTANQPIKVIIDFSPGVANTGLGAQLINCGAGNNVAVYVYAIL